MQHMHTEPRGYSQVVCALIEVPEDSGLSARSYLSEQLAFSWKSQKHLQHYEITGGHDILVAKLNRSQAFFLSNNTMGITIPLCTTLLIILVASSEGRAARLESSPKGQE